MKSLFLSLLLCYATLSSNTDIVLGVVPQQAPAVLIKKWQSVADYLSKTTGLNVTLSIEKSIPEFEKGLKSGEYDIAYMNPYHYVLSHEQQGYEAKVRAKKMIVGILVAREELDLNSTNLKKMKYLFPSPLAFAATLLTKYELKQKYGVDVDKECRYLYVNSHDSVYKGVARNVGDIGGGIERTFNNISDKATKEQLKIVYRTSSYPSHPIAFHPRLDENSSRVLEDALLSMPSEILKSLSMKKMIKTDDKEYDSIREISKDLSLD